ncbi:MULTISPECIES: hypothetical protein [unclassified Mesorhizobium]|uniref:hypothetical protein n=1 Tax=unclassified Mesorhizobium TaxID=325217 RepID=UPI0013E2DF0E|nr:MULTISPECIES: hypothetical protein [unclassified Mesorhizobium]
MSDNLSEDADMTSLTTGLEQLAGRFVDGLHLRVSLRNGRHGVKPDIMPSLRMF